MKKILIYFVAVLLKNMCRVHGNLDHKPSADYYDNLINDVNEAGASWKAGRNFDGFNMDKLSHLFGSMEPSASLQSYEMELKHSKSHFKSGQMMGDKDEFDARLKWPKCPSIGRVPNQGRCAADWVIAPLSSITDRICISSNASFQTALSSHEPLSCCKTCGYGCQKGYASIMFKKYVSTGFVTGEEYNSKKGCQPYEVAPCKNPKICSSGRKIETPKCKPYCYNSAYKKKYEEDRHKGYDWFRGCPCCVSGEIKQYGPITGTLMVYEDFLTYKSGIYHHVKGKRLGHLTVKIIGYNFKNENASYWLAINSWGKKWGDNGTFKIKRDEGDTLLEAGLFGAWVEKPDDDDDDSN